MGAPISGVLSTGIMTNIPADAKAKDSPAKIHDAASQFEGLLIGEMFKAMHEDGEEGWLGSGDDQTASTAMGMADEFLAQAIAKHGGFGLAKTIDRQFERSDADANSPTPAKP